MQKISLVLLVFVSLAGPCFAADEKHADQPGKPRSIAMLQKPADDAPAADRKKAKSASRKSVVDSKSMGFDPAKELMAAVPHKELEDAVNNLATASDKVARVAYKKFDEVSAWVGRFFKQMNSMPVATPIASPYVQTGSTAQRFWTPEGRIKTCVTR